ncbi:hypothetical protein QTI66_04260 [Variovorax sp. J22R133]|uniref:hypothetical protein n=1 Tax=Variovorax brevis TaxID=3053503 RepID=UPI0025751F7D|nr:hypothetical protein [Variovorax sp. J22R133]MDM0111348.1 hypothetical protein [Variovorax sp. J22R133]
MRSLFLMSSLVLTATMAMAGPEPTLPGDINMVAPAADLPAPVAGYAGKWTGTWIGAGDRLNHVLIVENIAANAFSAVYAWGDSQGEYANAKAGWRRINGTVADGKLSAKIGQANVVYVLNPNGTISGTYTNARGFESKATLKKDG